MEVSEERKKEQKLHTGIWLLSLLIVILFFSTIFWVTYSAWAAPTITITNVTNKSISGEVKPLLDPAYYKIVVYMQDNYGWSKHPHPGHKEGFSWASIRQDGSWTIGKVARFSQRMQFNTNVYLVTLVHKDTQMPDRVASEKMLKRISSVMVGKSE